LRPPKQAQRSVAAIRHSARPVIVESVALQSAARGRLLRGLLPRSLACGRNAQAKDIILEYNAMRYGAE